MALKPVADPALLSQLNAAPAGAAGRQPVTDPALLAALEGAPAPATAHEEPASALAAGTIGAGELALQGISGALAKPVSGLVGAVSAPFVGANRAADIVRGAQEKLTFQPGKAGQRLASEISSIVTPVAEAIGAPIERALAAAGPAAETFVPAAAEALVEAGPLGAALRPVRAAIGAARPSPAVPKTPRPDISPRVAAARRAGFDVRPSDVEAISPGAKVPGLKREKLLSTPDLKRNTILKNQRTITRLAGEDLGLKNAARLDEAEFNKVKAPHFKTYDRVETAARSAPSTPEFDAAFTDAFARGKFKPGAKPSITKTIAEVRRRARKNQQSDVIATQEEGFADALAADRLEEEFGKRLVAGKNEKALGDYQAARQSLAKIHDVEIATKAGQVDAAALVKLNKRTGGKRLTGRLKIIAETAESFPAVTRHSSSVAAGSRATGTGESGIPLVSEGFRAAKSGLKATTRAVGRPFTDVGSESFQSRVFGPRATAAQQSFFEDFGKRVVPTQRPGPRVPEQGEIDLRDVLGLEPAPGEFGVPPSDVLRPLGDQFGLDIPGPAILENAPGTVGLAPSAILRELEARGFRNVRLKGPKGRK